MNAKAFDRLTKRAARGTTRRDLLCAGVAAAIGALVIGRESKAQETCNDPFVLCDGECVYVLTSAEHCGACGNTCDQSVCVDGVCTTCDEQGLAECVDPFGTLYCADLSTSFNDCGVCRNMCTTGPCENGTCLSTQDCEPGLTECLGVCVDLQTDVAHCGACSNACMGVPGPGQSSVGECVAGQCQLVCIEGYSLCDGACLEGGCPSGDEPTEEPSIEPTVASIDGRDAHVHRGTCDRLRKDPMWALTDLTAPTGERDGSRRSNVAEVSSSVIAVSLDDLLATSHVVHVHALAPDAQDVIVCGEIGGVRQSDGSLAIGLREVAGSGFEGIASLTPNASDSSLTDIWVFVAQALAEEDVTPSTDASPVAD